MPDEKEFSGATPPNPTAEPSTTLVRACQCLDCLEADYQEYTGEIWQPSLFPWDYEDPRTPEVHMGEVKQHWRRHADC